MNNNNNSDAQVEAVAININRQPVDPEAANNDENKIPENYICLSDISNVNDQIKANNSRLFALSFLINIILLITCVSNNFQIQGNSLQIQDLYRKITDLEDNHSSNNIRSENQPLQRQLRLFVDSERQLKVDYLNGTIESLYDLNELQGEQGIQGEQGPQGPEGPQGIQGIQGEPGIQSEVLEVEVSPIDENKVAPGAQFIGRGWNSFTDTFSANILALTFEKSGKFTQPITNEVFKLPDYISEGNYRHTNKYDLLENTRIYENTLEYQSGHSNVVGGDLGYSAFFSGSTSYETESMMNGLTKEDTAVAESTMQNNVFEVDADTNLIPYVKEEVKSIADNLPEWDENTESTVKQFQDFSMSHNDFIVIKGFFGGSMTKQTIISGYSELKESKDESELKYAASFGFGPWSGSIDGSSSNYNEESISEIKKKTSSSAFIRSSSSVGDPDNPDSVVTNINNWTPVEFQTYFSGSRIAPVATGYKVIPIYMLFDGQTRENLRSFLEWKYGSANQTIYDATKKFNEGQMANQKKMEDMKDNLENEITNNYNELKGEMVTGINYHSDDDCDDLSVSKLSTTSCGSNKYINEISQTGTVGINERYFWVYKVKCCPLPTVVKN